MKAIKIDDCIVPYEIKYGKYKRLSMKYDAREQKLVILANRWISGSKIEDFIKRKHSWILQQVNKPWKVVSIGQEIDVFGKRYPVRVVLSNKNVVQLQQECIVYTTSKISDEEIVKRLKQFLKKCLQEYITSIYDQVSSYTKVPNVKIRYRYMTSRFGVCYALKKEICLNTYLACFSKKAIHAVLFHEYAHFYQPNHSKKYYDVLYKMYPSYEMDMLELKYVVF